MDCIIRRNAIQCKGRTTYSAIIQYKIITRISVTTCHQLMVIIRAIQILDCIIGYIRFESCVLLACLFSPSSSFSRLSDPAQGSLSSPKVLVSRCQLLISVSRSCGFSVSNRIFDFSWYVRFGPHSLCFYTLLPRCCLGFLFRHVRIIFFLSH